MAFQNNQRFNSPNTPQIQQFPGSGSPFAAGSVMPGSAMPGMMFGQPPGMQGSPLNVSLPGFLPINQSSPLGQVSAGMPQMNQGPHVRLFSPGVTNPQQPCVAGPMPVPPVVSWGAGAVTGPTIPGVVAGQRFNPPQGNPFMQVQFSQSSPQNFNNLNTTANQRRENGQKRNDWNTQATDRDRNNRQNDNYRRDDRGAKSEMKEERDNHFDRRGDRGGYSNRREERRDNSPTFSAQDSGRHRLDRHSRRDERRHRTKGSSRDASRDSESRHSSSDRGSHRDSGNHRDRDRMVGGQRFRDRPPDNPDTHGNQNIGRRGAVLLEDRDEHVSVGRSGAVLMEDSEGRPSRRIGKTGAILKDDRDDERPIVRDDRSHNRDGRGRGGASSRRGFHGNRRDVRDEQRSRSNDSSGDRAFKRDRSWEPPSRDRSESRNRDQPSKRPRTGYQRTDTEAASDERVEKGNNSEDGEDSELSASGYEKQWRDEAKLKVKNYLSLREHSKYWDALYDLEKDNGSETEQTPEDDTPAWVRCSSSDLYLTKDPKTGCTFGTKKMQDLENKFEYDLVLRNERVKKSHTVPEQPSKFSRLHFHDEDSDSSSNESDSEVEEEITEEWMEELKKKQEDPYRLHPEIWHNEPGQLNDGPLCRCSLKNRKTGIRHNKFPGEKPVPLCDPNSNNKDKLYHYRLSVAPTTNFLAKTPSMIFHDSHEYMFEGFSLFTHTKITEKIPLCKLMRFSIVYTIFTIDETFPENFTVRSLDLFTRFLFTELLELFDLDWKGLTDDNSCQRFHVMPRFARQLPENGKELLSMNEVLRYLLKSSKPIIDPTQLDKLLKLNRSDWTNFVDEFRGMIVTCPGKKPSSLRVDQLDKSHCEENDGGTVSYPLIVHCGIRPAQLSYAGDPEYKKKWREYMKFRHLFFSRPKVSAKDKEKLEEMMEELYSVRLNSNMKRDITVEFSCEGFYRTGLRTDISQHCLLLPVLFDHLRFHDCLKKFEEDIGYTFNDRYLLQLAFTHSSYKVNFGTNSDHVRNSLTNCGNRMVEVGEKRNHFLHTRKKGLTTLIKIMSTFGYKHEMKSEIPHNERLEFLGDAVIEFLSSIHLFFMFPYHDEGEMTTYRGSLVQNRNLTELARKIHLEDYMLYAHGPDLCTESTMKHAMANCFEALMAALMLDTGMLGGGLQQADKVFTRCLFDEPDLLEIWKNVPEHPLQLEEPNGDRHWIESSPALQKLVKFEEKIGVKFNHIRLLARALCHRSVGYNNLTLGNNQRLEFLGDTIIQLITSEYLFKHFPSHHEGHLTLLRSSLVNNRTQATVCEELGLVDFVINGENPSDTRHLQHHMRIKHKADLLEALLGALYVDGGLEFPKGLIEVCFFPRLEQFILNQDWNDPKSQLQQCCLVLRDAEDGDPDVPIYKIVGVSGPSNTRRYTVAVYFQGERLATGSNYAIQSAEMEAAAKALMEHKDRFLTPLFENSPWFNTKQHGTKANPRTRSAATSIITDYYDQQFNQTKVKKKARK